LVAFSACDWLDAPPAEQTYAVVRGDTLTVIASAHGVSVADLMAWNGLKNDGIEVGQVLVVGNGVAGVRVQKKRAGSRRAPHRPRQAVSKITVGVMPKAKPCLAGPSLDDLDDDVPDVQASLGLSLEEIRSPMAAALPALGVCFGGGWPETVVELNITVACNGRVQAVAVLDGGGLDASTLDCMRAQLGFVGFSAHDMPDGMQFRYPITLSK
jgi:murein DD-endopeptidase MepM/ murein hydrolase activator NlpD